jgi:hypothetical protein
MSKQQRRRLTPSDTDIRDTEHGDIWYTRQGIKYLMDKQGKIVTSYPIKGDSRPTVVKKPSESLSDYDLLKAAGHSPLKALQIASDAKRGEVYATEWVDQLRKQQ